MESCEAMKKLRVWYCKHISEIVQKHQEKEESMRYRQQKKSNTVATKAPLESEKNSLVERIESQGSLLIQDEWNMITQQDLPTEDNRS